MGRRTRTTTKEYLITRWGMKELSKGKTLDEINPQLKRLHHMTTVEIMAHMEHLRKHDEILSTGRTS